ncbi:unnamed protein product [Closterium sp. Yama58-4]|nr:unnamed protein product [Closterium sp. Yama58-4]
MERTRIVGSSTSLLPLINAGHVSSIWHDILLIPPPASPPSGSSSPPRHRSVSPFSTPAFSFVCRSAKSLSADCGGSRRLRRRDDPLFLREKRMVVIALDGSLTKVHPSPAESQPSPAESQTSPSSALLQASPWNLGILPQTCVLASRCMSIFSRFDAKGDSGGSDGRQGESRDNELTESLLTACDNAPLEALEIGSQARDPGDVYDVFPLLAMPLRLRGSGRNSMPISWRIVTIATDDELVTSGQLKHSLRNLLDRVREWAKKSDCFGEIVGPVTPPSSIPSSHSLISIPSSHSLISIPYSHSLISIPSFRCLISLPSSHSLISIPSSHSLISISSSQLLNSFPSLHSISIPSSPSLISIPSHSLAPIPSSHSFVPIPSSHSFSLLHCASIPFCSLFQLTITC